MGSEDSINDPSEYAGAIKCRNGRGDEVTINPALVVYVWSGKGIAQATRDSIDELTSIRPDAVCLHGGTADLLANLERSLTVLRVALADHNREEVRVWVGVGIDGSLDAWHAGKLSGPQVIERHAQLARLLARLGVEVIVLNGEGKWALRSGSTRSAADVRALASAVGRAYAMNAPSCVLALSSFGALGYHSDVRAMIEGLTPSCSIFTGQSYAARPGEVAKGVLPAVIARDEKSQSATERQGWIRPDVKGEDSPDDLDRLPTVQAHQTHPSDLCTLLCERPHVLVWSVPTIVEGGRADESGLQALQAAASMRRASGTGAGAVKRYQQQHGLTADGSPGPITRDRAIKGEP